jgi:hypothetical protein
MPRAEAVLVRESRPPDGETQGASDQGRALERESSESVPVRTNWRLRLGTLVVLATALTASVPTVGDLGLTWDEPAYRYSQVISVQWWEQLGRARSWSDVQELLDPQALLYYWPYGRFGINFHNPLAGQLNLAAHAVFGHWMKDIPARRMASVIEFALTITIGFHFLARRYGGWVGLVMAGSLLLMPRLYGEAHLMDTDTPGLLLWAATALAFWKGLHEPDARRWRVAVGILLGLAFVQKMGAVVVLGPLLIWLTVGYLPPTLGRKGGRSDWIDGVLTTGAMLIPLGLAFQQIQMLQQRLLPPHRADLFNHRATSDWPGAILAVPLVIWLIRRLLGWWLPRHRVWGVERPALETWTAILAFAPVVGWLGNPAWWRDTLPRLTHYYTLSFDRQGVLPPIQIIYFGQIYEYSLPWHNGWVLLGITVPSAILFAGAIGLFWAIGQVRRDRLPFYFLIHFLTLPLIRMLPTPAHDGVRLFLPTFFFLAAFSGWGAIWLADTLAKRVRVRATWTRLAVTGVVLGSAAVALVRIHPYELSYYNELIGGPRGAWERGFELTYWYDAFNPKVIADLNDMLPRGAEVDYLNDKTDTSVMVFQELQCLGALRGDIHLGRNQADKAKLPFVWLLAQDSKSTAFTRLLYALQPWYGSKPAQLDGAPVAIVANPVAVARAWALQLLLDAADRSRDDPPAAPAWVQLHAPWLARFWGDGLKKPRKLTLNQTILDWSRSDPEGLLAVAKWIAAGRDPAADPNAKRLMDQIVIINPSILEWSRSDPEGLLAAARWITSGRNPVDDPNAKRLMDQIVKTGDRNILASIMRKDLFDQLMGEHAQALVEAVQILNAHHDEVVKVMSRFNYTDSRSLGG